jgi:hypothetical protein
LKYLDGKAALPSGGFCMNRTPKTLYLFVIGVFLTGCGGGGGDGVGDSAGVPNASLGEVFRAPPSGSLLEDPFAVDQAMRGNPEFTASNTQGATGVMAVATFLGGQPVLRDVRMSLSEDRSVLTLEIEGSSPVNLAVDGSASASSGQWGTFLNGQYVTLFMFDDTGTIAYSDNSSLTSPISGRGVFGLETPIDRLPSGSAIYTGEFTTIGTVTSPTAPVGGATEGTLTMAIDFSTQSISGTTAGTITYFEEGTGLQQDMGATGTISGTVSGNGIGGNFTLVGTVANANHTFEGNVFGYDGDDIGGGVIGSVTAPDGTGAIYGDFEASR